MENGRAVISVIMPAFNTASYINASIKSLAEQNYFDFELILIDDGSSDSTVEQAGKILKNSKIPHKIIIQPHAGVGSARNRGLAEASGKYIFPLDSDDIIGNDCLSNLYKAAKSSDADMAFCGFDTVDEAGKIIKSYKNEFRYIKGILSGKDALLKMLRQQIWIFTGNVLIKNSILKENHVVYPENCSYGEDQEFTMKALFHSTKVVNVAQSLFRYVQRPNSSAKAPSLKKFEFIDAYYRLAGYLERNKADDYLIEYIYSNKIPGNVLNILINLARNGYPKDDFLSLAKSDKVKSELKNYRISFGNLTEIKYFIKYILYSISPRLLNVVSRFKD